MRAIAGLSCAELTDGYRRGALSPVDHITLLLVIRILLLLLSVLFNAICCKKLDESIRAHLVDRCQVRLAPGAAVRFKKVIH
jgi:hypothetical protein